jgi:hypothetical protein
VGAFGREGVGDGATDAASAARDDGALSLQSEIHGRFSWCEDDS